MKNKIIGLLAGVAFFGVTANADIVLADGLSAYGYIDLVAVDTDQAAPEGDRSGDLNEYEIGLSFSPAESQWSAVVELSYGLDDANDTTTDFETVAVTYQHSDALSVHLGNLYTFQGLESDDAPDNDFLTYAGTGGEDLYGANYAEGIAVTYSVGDINLAAWSQADSDPIKQYAASYSGIENLTLGVAVIDYNDSTDSTNIHAVYELGDFTISAENVDSDNAAKILDVTSVAVAYNMGDTTIAVRTADGDYNGNDYESTSIAAFHALSDNVSAGIEYREEENEGQADVSAWGVELLYVF
jgi:hypothetical protein